jgi:hypothetical protein
VRRWGEWLRLLVRWYLPGVLPPSVSRGELMRRAGHNCRPPCRDRMAAISAGEFGYNFAVGGFTYFDGTRRRKNGAPMTFVECPWCGGDLPDGTEAIQAMLGDPEE